MLRSKPTSRGGMAGTMAVQATTTPAEDPFGGEEFTRASAAAHAGVSMSTNSTGEGDGKEVESVFSFAFKWSNSTRTSVHYSGGHPLNGFEKGRRRLTDGRLEYCMAFHSCPGPLEGRLG